MNGAEAKIEIFKPFGEAFDLTKVILFQPFDLKKWCVIGFAAFLSNLGGGFNFNYTQRSDLKELPGFQGLAAAVNQIPNGVLVLAVTVLVLLILAILIVFAWLRARGRFTFIDCIARNRAAIAEPWHEFQKEGNSYFLFSLLVCAGLLVIAAVLALPFLLPIVRRVTFLHMHDVYLISMIILWAVVVILLVLVWWLIAHFMAMVMYRRRCRALEGLRVALRLIASYPGEVTLYCLFWIVLVMGAVLIGCVSTCATCCLTLIPYVGTVILLPVFVCLRAFGLLFIRQFGPDFDVWAEIPQPKPPPLQAPPPLPA